ncbi:MAG: GNAT superfamily N-acetyltransferase [Myxococcota bacterium]|jgi:GNAT superfamily N-acetyltransferase
MPAHAAVLHRADRLELWEASDGARLLATVEVIVEADGSRIASIAGPDREAGLLAVLDRIPERRVIAAVEDGGPPSFERLLCRAGLSCTSVRARFVRRLSAPLDDGTEAIGLYDCAGVDAPTIARLIEETLAGTGLASDGTLAALREREGDDHDPSMWFVAHKEGAPIGLVFARPDGSNAALTWLGLLPEHRSKGLGEAMHMRVMRELGERGFVWWTACTDPRNRSMMRLLTNSGCSVAAVVRSYAREPVGAPSPLHRRGSRFAQPGCGFVPVSLDATPLPLYRLQEPITAS